MAKNELTLDEMIGLAKNAKHWTRNRSHGEVGFRFNYMRHTYTTQLGTGAILQIVMEDGNSSGKKSRAYGISVYTKDFDLDLGDYFGNEESIDQRVPEFYQSLDEKFNQDVESNREIAIKEARKIIFESLVKKIEEFSPNVAEEIADQLRTHYENHPESGIDRQNQNYKFFRDNGLVEKDPFATSIGTAFYRLTDEAKRLYERLKEEGYYRNK